MALLAASLVAVTIPIEHTGSSESSVQVNTAVTTEEAINGALRDQAEGLAALLATDLGSGGASAAAARLALTGPDGAAQIFVPLRTAPVSFTIHENGLASSRVTAQLTVTSALREMGVELNPADLVFPSRETQLGPGMHIYIDYADRIELVIGQAKTTVFTQAATVGAALTAAGYELQAQDVVFPSRTTAVEHGMIVGLSVLRDVSFVEDEAIPFNTVYEYDSELPEGEQWLQQAGSDGYTRREYIVRQTNGEETTRELVSESVVAPTAEVVVIGTYVEPAPAVAAPAPPPAVFVPPLDGDCAVRQVVWATYYTAASAGGNGITATGTGVYKGIIAVDPNYIPLGTKMYVPGYGYGVAADTGGGVKGWHVDLGYGPNDAYDWGSHYVEICIF